MKASSRFGVALGLIVLMGAISGSALAQAAAGGQRGQGRQRGGNNNNGGNFDPAQMRERYLLQLKEQLASPDEEWKLIQPKLDKVLTVQRDTRGSRNFGGRNRGGN